MTGKKILLFAPYGFWTIHHQVDAVIGAALRLRGCEVCILTCDGVFENCPISGGVTNKAFCQKCNEAAVQLFSIFSLPIINLSSLLNKNDWHECKNWADGIPVEVIPNAVFEGAKIGEWVCAGMHSHFLTGHLDFSKQDVGNMNRSFLCNGALLKRVYDNLLKNFYPDHVICFQGILAYYRIILELSRQHAIPVLVHEVAPIEDAFIFRMNENFHGLSGMVSSWQEWKKIPLNLEECSWVKQYYTDSYKFFYKSESDANTVRKNLRIPSDSRIILLFTSGNWEIGMAKGQFIQTFDTQVDFISKMVAIFASRDEYLIIRHHPSNVGSSYTDFDFLQRLFSLNRGLPQNVRVVMPTEKLSSYAVAWNADGAISFGSTVGIEVAMRGVSAYSARRNLNTALEVGVEMIQSPSDCERAVDDVIRMTQNFSLEYLRRVYRSIYFSFIRFSYNFKSFRIHSGSWPSREDRRPDIRIKNIQELSEGNDPALDHICNHILYDKPLFRSPNEERERSEKEETEFLEKELKEIMVRRADVREYALKGDYKEPLITVVRIRQDGIFEPENTILYRSVKRSRHRNIEQVEMAFPFFFDKAMFIHELSVAADRAKGKYVWFGTDNIHVDESLFSSATDFLETPENETFEGVITGAWICDKEGKITGEIFTERKDMNDYAISVGILPLLQNPEYLLTFFIWRKSSLLKLISDLEKVTNTLRDISLEIFKQTISEHSDLNLNKTLIPNITLYVFPDAESLMSDAIALFNDKKWKEASNILDKCKNMGANIQSLDYYRTVAKISLGKFWEARITAEARLKAEPSDEQTKSLIQDILQKSETTNYQYKDIESSVETVDGHLVLGQEKFLFDKVRSLPEGAAILEIGSNHGRSTVSMAFGCVGTNKRIFSIDTFIGMRNGGTNKYGNTFFDIWYLNVRRLALENYITPLQGFSHECLSQWGDKPNLDFVFIDASHHYVDVLKDFELVYPLVKDGGWIAFHDMEPGWPGPWRVWRETAMPLLSSHEYFSNLACGRKEPGRPFVRLPRRSTFSYSKEWSEYLANYIPQLSEAMKIIMAASEDNDPKIEAAGQFIANMPDQLKTSLREMLKLEASVDPFLHFWNALTLEKEGDIEKAIESLQKAISISSPSPNKLIGRYLERLNKQAATPECRDIADTVPEVEPERTTDAEKPLCLFYTTYYQGFMDSHYRKKQGLTSEPHSRQKESLHSEFFGDSDFYSKGLKNAGWDAEDFISNCLPLQQSWAQENSFSGKGLEIVVEQIRQLKPQVVYLHDMGLGTTELLFCRFPTGF